MRRHLVARGWRTTNMPKTIGAHDADIRAFHPRWRKTCIIEVKGSSKSHPHQAVHNGFWSVLGEILTRMDIEGNYPKKARYYAIGFPKEWENTFRNKVAKMRYGWTLLRLNVLLVDHRGQVEQRTQKHLL